MSKISQYREENGRISALLLTHDIAKANILRRALMNHIETYCIEYVTIFSNQSPLEDEKIAFLLGQLVIDQEAYQGGDDYSFLIEWTGPTSDEISTRVDNWDGLTHRRPIREITTDDLPQLPFRYQTPIMMLRKGDLVRARLTLKRGQGRDHVKWRPVSAVALTEQPDGFLLSFREIGMLSGQEIFRRALEKMEEAAQEAAQTIFTRQTIWHD